MHPICLTGARRFALTVVKRTGSQRVTSDGLSSLATGSDGQFQTPPRCVREWPGRTTTRRSQPSVLSTSTMPRYWIVFQPQSRCSNRRVRRLALEREDALELGDGCGGERVRVSQWWDDRGTPVWYPELGTMHTAPTKWPCVAMCLMVEPSLVVPTLNEPSETSSARRVD